MTTPSRRRFLKTSSLIFGATALASLSGVSCSGTKKRPNIIFLLADDQRWDTVGAMGNKYIQTPNLDAIAQRGTLFTNAFVTTSICCTSRASIFLGQYARRHSIWDFSTDFTKEQWAQSYPKLLRRAGYFTGFIGKFGVGQIPPAETFEFWEGITGQPEYEQVDENGVPIHLTRLMGSHAVQFLQSYPKEQPFCLSISFKAPHVQDNDPRQFIYDEELSDLYEDVTIPKPRTAVDRYYNQFPEFFREKNEGRRRWELRFATPEMYQTMVKGYYRLVTGIDTVLGKIFDELDNQDLAEDTIIIYSSDNGFFLGEHGLAGKWYGYEESIRIPMIIYNPRTIRTNRGLVRNEAVLNIDIMPTILDIAGVDIPEVVQGKSMMPLTRGERPDWREDFFYEHLFEYDGRIPRSEGVVGERYKYLRYVDEDPVYEELYDLKMDPFEERNVASRPDYADILIDMRQRCDELKEAAV